MTKQLWDGKKRESGLGPCSCGAPLYMEGVFDTDGPQVYLFCEKCSFRQPMIARKHELTAKDIAWATKRARELGLGPSCSTS